MIGKDIVKMVQKAVDTNITNRQMKKLQRQQQTRVEDLYKKFHRVGSVSLPIMNAFAEDLIKKVFAGIDSMDLTKSVDLGIIIYILENQENKELVDEPVEEIKRQGMIRLQAMPVELLPEFVYAIDDMFIALKKKVDVASKEILEKMEKRDGEAHA